MGMRHAAARNGISITRLLLAGAMALLAVGTPDAQRAGFPDEEFSARRQRLAAALKEGALVMFGATQPTPGRRFRQDNDFYYLTGNESLNAALLLDAASGASQLFLPAQDAVEIRYEGANWLQEPGAAKRRGKAGQCGRASGAADH